MPRNPKSRARARILVIDDDRSVLEATAMLLEGEGFAVTAVSDGQAAEAAVQVQAFDLALVDVFMPGMDGLETTRAIVRHRPGLPVIAVSGFMLGHWRLEMPNFENMATEAGAVATLYKPFRPAALLQAIADVLARGAAPADAGDRKVLSA
jgi:CheY-like chemotaxis protein